MHIFVSVFAAIVAAGWFLSWCAKRKDAKEARIIESKTALGLHFSAPHLYPDPRLAKQDAQFIENSTTNPPQRRFDRVLFVVCMSVVFSLVLIGIALNH